MTLFVVTALAADQAVLVGTTRWRLDAPDASWETTTPDGPMRVDVDQCKEGVCTVHATAYGVRLRLAVEASAFDSRLGEVITLLPGVTLYPGAALTRSFVEDGLAVAFDLSEAAEASTWPAPPPVPTEAFGGWIGPFTVLSGPGGPVVAEVADAEAITLTAVRRDPDGVWVTLRTPHAEVQGFVVAEALPVPVERKGGGGGGFWGSPHTQDLSLPVGTALFVADVSVAEVVSEPAVVQTSGTWRAGRLDAELMTPLGVTFAEVDCPIVVRGAAIACPPSPQTPAVLAFARRLDAAALDGWVAALKADETLKLVVAGGHTETESPRAGEKRARAVVKALTSDGVSSRRLATEVVEMDAPQVHLRGERSE